MRKTWHAATSGSVFDLVRYWYANGRPSRVEAANVSSDLQTLNGYTTYYLEYNWHGDATNFVTSDGIGGNNATLYNPWGSGINAGPAWNYYGWGGGWGYLGFANLGLYYVHGRWYNPDIGRFISPDAKGDYRYGSGDDAVNYAWVQSILPRTGGGGDYTCNVITGCNVPYPIRADCANNGCRLDARLDRAVLFYSGVYGIPPELLGATLVTEQLNDKGWYSDPLDIIVGTSSEFALMPPLPGIIPGFLRSAGNVSLGTINFAEVLHGSPGIGANDIHSQTAWQTAEDFQTYYSDTAMANLLNPAATMPELLLTLLSTDGNMRYAAAYLRRLADLRTRRKQAHFSDLTDTDMAIIYGAYRAGTQSFGRPEEFQTRQTPGEKYGVTFLRYLQLYKGYYP